MNAGKLFPWVERAVSKLKLISLSQGSINSQCGAFVEQIPIEASSQASCELIGKLQEKKKSKLW